MAVRDTILKVEDVRCLDCARLHCKIKTTHDSIIIEVKCGKCNAFWTRILRRKDYATASEPSSI